MRFQFIKGHNARMVSDFQSKFKLQVLVCEWVSINFGSKKSMLECQNENGMDGRKDVQGL